MKPSGGGGGGCGGGECGPGAADLDTALGGLGQFGRFQAFYFAMLLLPIMLCGYRTTEYIFTMMDIKHRCYVPECDSAEGTTDWSPSWLGRAVPPGADGGPQPCLRFAPNGSEPAPTTTPTPGCPADLFTDREELCDRWVFGESAVTMAKDFKILCPDDQWRLTLLSSLNVFTSFIGLAPAGILSDKFGRKVVLVAACAMLSVSGLARSLSPSYKVSAALELFDGLLLNGCTWNPAFLLAVESVTPAKRLLANTIVNIFFTSGEIVMALDMWVTQNWRVMQRVFYGPMLAIIALYWLLPESVRWLHTQRRHDDVAKFFKKMAKMNKTEDKLQNALSILQAPPVTLSDKDASAEVGEVGTDRETGSSAHRQAGLVDVLRSPTMLWRVAACSMCWLASIFGYYGISQNAVTVGGDRYVNFLLVSAVEVPAYVGCLWLPGVPALGRRRSTAIAFLSCAAACVANLIIKPEAALSALALTLCGKFCATVSITLLCIYTAELFPTELRNSLLSFCTISSNLGMILAQQMPLIEAYVPPMLVFGAVTAVGGALALTFPETLGTKLPDTIREAEDIGRTKTESTVDIVGT